MINTNSLAEARKMIEKLKKEDREVVVYAQDEKFNRKIIENKKVDVLLGAEFSKSQYPLNEVLCKLAKENDIKIGIDISRIAKLDKLEKAKVLAKVMKNIFLCKKIGAKIMLYTENSNKEKKVFDNKISKQESIGFFVSFKGM